MPVTLHGTYYTATEAAERLGYASQSYLARRCVAGEIPAIKLGQTWLIPESVVLELDRQEVKGQGKRGIARK